MRTHITCGFANSDCKTTASDGNDSDTLSETTVTNASATRKRKRGKKCQWECEDLDDFVDIIVNDENHQRKLIFQNTMSKTNKSNYESILKELKSRAEKRGSVFDKSIVQMRNKFKKLVSECKKANMVFKTSTGISNYKDEKNYSGWFDMLFPLIKSRDSCQPEQAMEPSAGQASSDIESEFSMFNDDPQGSELTEKSSEEKLFVPKLAKKPKKGQDKLIEKTTEVLDSVKSLLGNQQTSTFLEFMEKENARARAHELEILKMLIPATQPQAPSQYEAQAWQAHGPASAPPASSMFARPLSYCPQPNSFPVNNVNQAVPFTNSATMLTVIMDIYNYSVT